MWAFALVVPLALVCTVVYTIAITRSTANAWKQPGGKLINFCPSAAAYAVGASTKSLNFANAGATASATITLLGRSA